MTGIVTTTYRYKRPPRKQQAVPLDVPKVVKAADPAKAHEIGRILPISVEAVAASSKQLKLERAKWGRGPAR
jgi:hypothetical protein